MLVSGTRSSMLSDLRWWSAVFLSVLAVAVAMYAAAFAAAPENTLFPGFLLNAGDAWSYWAFARRFAGSGFLVDNPFTATPRPPAYFNLAWFAAGKAMAVTGLPFLAIYYAFGVLAAGLMFWVILRFAREFAGDGSAGRFAFLLASLGGGIGWILRLISKEAVTRLRPMDLFHHEGYPLESALFMPHFALSIALVGAIMLAFWRGVSTGRRTWSCAAALLTLALGFLHPYHSVTVGCVTGTWIGIEQVIDRRRLHRGWVDLGALALGVLPAVFYYRWLFRQPNWSFWKGANVVLSGGPLAVALGLGPLLLLAAAGAWRCRRKLDAGRRFLLVWSLVGLGLLFSHRLFPFEAKLIEGLILPLSCLGAWAFFDQAGRGSLRRRIAAGAMLVALLPSPVVLAAESLSVAGGGWRESFFPVDWLYGTLVSKSDMAAFDYMNRRMSASDLLMTTVRDGRLIPAVADVRLFIGGTGSPDLRRCLSLSNWYYGRAGTSAERYAMLRQNGVTHVLWDVFVDSTLRPWDEPYLEPVYQSSGEVSIWRVR